MAEPLPTLVLCRDLMFVGKVTATARALNVPVKVIRDPATLIPEGTHLIVDLNQDGALAAAAAWKAATAGRVTAFVAHVDADLIAQARAAGLDRVMARSAFTATLEQILTGPG